MNFSFIFLIISALSIITRIQTSSSLQYRREMDIPEMRTNAIIVKEEMGSDVQALQPEMVMPLQSRSPSSLVPRLPTQSPIIIRLDPTSFNLPNNWVVEQRYRSSPKYAKRSDKFFYEPDEGKMFRSLKAAKKFLQEKSNPDLQNGEPSQG